MSSDCGNVQSDIQQRIVALSARIYSHQSLVSQYTQEKERLETILAELNDSDTGGDDDSGSEGEGDGGATETTTQMVYHTSSTSMANDGPFK